MDRLNVRTIVQTISATTRYNIAGAYMRLIDFPAGTISLEFFRGNVSIGTADNFLPGLAVEGLAFDAFTVTPSAPGQVTLVVGDAPVKYDRAAGSVTVSGTPSVTISGTPNVAVSNLPAKQGAYTRASIALQDNVTATQLFPANPNRRYLLVQNNHSSATYLRLRVDGTQPTPGEGLRIGAGGYYESQPGFAPTGAVWVIATAAGGVPVEALEG